MLLSLKNQLSDMIKNGFFLDFATPMSRRLNRWRPCRFNVVGIVNPKHWKEESVATHNLANKILPFDLDIGESEIASVLAVTSQNPALTKIALFDRDRQLGEIVL